MNEWMNDSSLFQMEKPATGYLFLNMESDRSSFQRLPFLSRFRFWLKHLEWQGKIKQLCLSSSQRVDITEHSQPRTITKRARRKKNKELWVEAGGIEERVLPPPPPPSQPWSVRSTGFLLLVNSLPSLERIQYVLFRDATVGNNDFWFKVGGKLCIGWITSRKTFLLIFLSESALWQIYLRENTRGNTLFAPLYFFHFLILYASFWSKRTQGYRFLRKANRE